MTEGALSSKPVVMPADGIGQAGFDDAPVLIGPTLSLRPLVEADLDGMAEAGGEPETWAGHPARDRHKREVFEANFRFLLSAGGTLTVRDRRTDAIIGCSRYYVPPDQPGDIGIGFTFLRHTYWGGETNFELKRLMLDHAFSRFETVWFHIGPSNIRSQKATAKLGAVHVYDATLRLASSPAEWMCFRLDRNAWREARERLAAKWGPDGQKQAESPA